MRLFLLLIAAALALPLTAAAQTANADAPAAKKESRQEEPTLDQLFQELANETNTIAGRRTAQRIWDQWSRSESDTINSLMLWAEKAISEGKNAVAEDLLTQVIALEPGFAEGWNRRASLFYAQGKASQSLGDIEQTLRLEPRHFGALSGLAAILQSTGKEALALEVWHRVLAIYPAHAQAQKSVIELEEKLAGQRS
jgi:tetratricopeptide (TPR) repeat protein